MHCQYYALFQGLYLFPLYINIGICSSHLILVSSLYIREITIKFQRKCFKGKVVRVHGFRWKFKVIYKELQDRMDSVRDGMVMRMTVLVPFRYITAVLPVLTEQLILV